MELWGQLGDRETWQKVPTSIVKRVLRFFFGWIPLSGGLFQAPPHPDPDLGLDLDLDLDGCPAQHLDLEHRPAFGIEGGLLKPVL